MNAIARILTGRRTASIVLLGCLLALGLALAFVPRPSSTAIINPATAGDSRAVSQWESRVPAADLTNALVVWTRTDDQAFSLAQQSTIKDRAAALAALFPAPKTAWTQLSDDRTVILAVVPVRTSALLANAPAAADSLTSTAGSGLPSGVRVQLTGDVATAVSRARAIDDAPEWALLAGLLAIAVVVLILATRSMVLWLVPLVLVAASSAVSLLAASAIDRAAGLPMDATGSPVVLGLAVGVGTAYSAIYLMRYRAELRLAEDRSAAGIGAWTSVAPAIGVASVIFALGACVFLFAADAGVRALALAAVIAVVIETLTILLAVPPAVGEFGRRGFWPSVPLAADSAVDSRGGLAGAIGRRSVLATVVTTVVVGVVASAGAVAFVAATAPQPDASAAQARASIDRAYTPGYGNQAVMLVPSSLAGNTSIYAPTTLAMISTDIHAVTVGASHAGRTLLLVDLHADPGSATARSTITTVRKRLAATGGPTATTLVGGADAEALDRSRAAAIDLETAVPIALVLALVLTFVADLRERRMRVRVRGGLSG